MAINLHLDADSEEVESPENPPLSEEELAAFEAREAIYAYLCTIDDALRKWLQPYNGPRPHYPINTHHGQTLLTHPDFLKWTSPTPRPLSDERLNPTPKSESPSSILRLIYPETFSPKYICPPARFADVYLYEQEKAISGPDPENWPWPVKALLFSTYCNKLIFGLGPQGMDGTRKVSCYEVARTLICYHLTDAGMGFDDDEELQARVRRMEQLKALYDTRPEGEEVIGDESVGKVLETALMQLGEDGWRVSIIIDRLEECEGYEWLVEILSKAVESDGGKMAGTFRVMLTGSKEAIECGRLARWPALKINSDGEVEGGLGTL